VLFFELFPAFMALVSVAIAVGLYISNRSARNDPPDPVVTVKRPAADAAASRTPVRRRPSMSA
jgi:hypothetical protein